jgi:hypothetical protein
LHLHQEDPLTGHTNCPGRNVAKADLIHDLQQEILRRDAGDQPADEGGNIGVVRTAPNDPLNLRENPGTQAGILAALEDGTEVIVMGGRDVESTRWLNVRAADKLGWVAARFVSFA